VGTGPTGSGPDQPGRGDPHAVVTSDTRAQSQGGTSQHRARLAARLNRVPFRLRILRRNRRNRPRTHHPSSADNISQSRFETHPGLLRQNSRPCQCNRRPRRMSDCPCAAHRRTHAHARTRTHTHAHIRARTRTYVRVHAHARTCARTHAHVQMRTDARAHARRQSSDEPARARETTRRVRADPSVAHAMTRPSCIAAEPLLLSVAVTGASAGA
jgi:hypothetical protein